MGGRNEFSLCVLLKAKYFLVCFSSSILKYYKQKQTVILLFFCPFKNFHCAVHSNKTGTSQGDSGSFNSPRDSESGNSIFLSHTDTTAPLRENLARKSLQWPHFSRHLANVPHSPQGIPGGRAWHHAHTFTQQKKVSGQQTSFRASISMFPKASPWHSQHIPRAVCLPTCLVSFCHPVDVSNS